MDENENNSSKLTLNGSGLMLDDSTSGGGSPSKKKDDLFSVHDFDINIDVSTPIG